MRPRVLMTVPDVAWPLDGGKRLRVESLVRAVSARADVDIAVLFADGDPAVRPVPPDVAVRRWAVIPPAPRPALQTGLAAARHRVPWQTAAAPWEEVRRTLRTWPGPYDLVWFGALDHLAGLGGDVTAARTVVDCDDVETAKWRGFLQTRLRGALPLRDQVQRRLELPLWGRLQRAALREADAVLVCSELDGRRLRHDSGPGPVVVLPNTYPGPDAVVPRRPADPPVVVVLANYGTDQNLDGATWAATALLPALRARVPGLRLRLVGRRAERLARLVGTDGLDVVGPVEDVRPELSRASVVLVPVRYGGGTRLKVLEAFAHGVPVVSTTLGAEGLEAVDGEHLLLADAPVAVAEAVARLLADPGLADRLAREGRLLWEREYRPDATARRVDTLLDGLLADVPRTAGPGR